MDTRYEISLLIRPSEEHDSRVQKIIAHIEEAGLEYHIDRIFEGRSLRESHTIAMSYGDRGDAKTFNVYSQGQEIRDYLKELTLFSQR